MPPKQPINELDNSISSVSTFTTLSTDSNINDSDIEGTIITHTYILLVFYLYCYLYR